MHIAEPRHLAGGGATPGPLAERPAAARAFPPAAGYAVRMLPGVHAPAQSHQALQESLTKAVASSSSCTQRLLAAAQGCPVAGAAAGAVTGDSSTQEAAYGAVAAGSSERLAGTAEPVSPGSDDSEGSDIAAAVSHSEYLSTRLLVRMNQSFSMPFLVLHNTLTRKQIARMLVSSYPFVPRPGPLMEAAVQHLEQLRAGKEAAAAAAEADAMQDAQD